jgi:hypothetical protein
MRWFWQRKGERRPCEPRIRYADCSGWTEEDRFEFLRNTRCVTPGHVPEGRSAEQERLLRQHWESVSLPVITAKLVIDFPLDEIHDIEVEFFDTPRHESWAQLRRPNGEYVRCEEGILRASQGSDAVFVWRRLMAMLRGEPEPDPEEHWERVRGSPFSYLD